MDLDLVSLIEPVNGIAVQASERILTIYKRGFSVVRKADSSPLTEADMAAHEVLVEGLADIVPNVPVLSEEDVDISHAERQCWDWLWLVDPLDGTREFIKQNDEFCINIALVHGHEAVFGLILVPVTGVCYFACRHGGAFKQAPGGPPEAIHARRIGKHPVRVAGSHSSYRGRPLRTYLEYLGRHNYFAVGSALKSCLVAEGKVDLYPRFGPTSEWDTAAAQVIVEEAGGGLTDTFMRPLRYNARPTLINPDFFAFGDPDQDWSKYLPRRKPRF